MSKMPRHPEAFSKSPRMGGRRPRVHDIDHLSWVATLPCVFRGYGPHIHVAHVRYANPLYGKPQTGMAEKPGDRWVVPLSHDLHLNGPKAQHGSNEQVWWANRGLDPLLIALALWGCTGDTEQAEILLAAHRQLARNF